MEKKDAVNTGISVIATALGSSAVLELAANNYIIGMILAVLCVGSWWLYELLP